MVENVVIIPSRNEADSIGEVARRIDAGLTALGLTGNSLIINTDNSLDGETSAAFLDATTNTPKISVRTGGEGKGDNILHGLRLALGERASAICMFDGDLESFDPSWLGEYLAALEAGKDFVAPRYARYWIEGGTTNHLSMPTVHALAPAAVMQPIAGDFGLSARLARRLLSEPATQEQREYGIDFMISGTAIFEAMAIAEVALGQKIHKPSFDKTEATFLGAASSMFDLIARYQPKLPTGSHSTIETQPLLDAAPISKEKLAARAESARQLLRDCGIRSDEGPIDAEHWIEIVRDHIARAYNDEPGSDVARSIWPYFLLRTVEFLSEARSGAAAAEIVADQARRLQRSLS